MGATSGQEARTSLTPTRLTIRRRMSRRAQAPGSKKRRRSARPPVDQKARPVRASVAMALAELTVEPAYVRAFVSNFLGRWGQVGGKSKPPPRAGQA